MRGKSDLLSVLWNLCSLFTYSEFYFCELSLHLYCCSHRPFSWFCLFCSISSYTKLPMILFVLHVHNFLPHNNMPLHSYTLIWSFLPCIHLIGPHFPSSSLLPWKNVVVNILVIYWTPISVSDSPGVCAQQSDYWVKGNGQPWYSFSSTPNWHPEWPNNLTATAMRRCALVPTGSPTLNFPILWHLFQSAWHWRKPQRHINLHFPHR